jgi:hypothetical protein
MQNKTLRALCLVVVAAGLATASAWAQVPGLQNQDVGNPGVDPALAGSTTFADGKYTIRGGGSDIWNTADGFHYAFIGVTGDFDYVVKVESLEGPDNWTKAELMAREVDTLFGLMPTGSDRHISTMTTRAAGQNEVALQWRSNANGSGSAWPNDIGISTPLRQPTYPNTWLRLERVGSKFWGYASSDGTSWVQLRGSPYDFLALNGTETTPREGGNMANQLAIGMAVTSHNNALDAALGVGVFTDFGAYARVPIQITTQPPATLSTSANSTLEISVVATGDPIHYEWRRNGTPIPGIGDTPDLVIPLIQQADAGSYTVRMYGAGQTEVISSPTAVTITVDTTPPLIVDAKGSASFTQATVTFNEPVTAPTATTAGNYTIAGLAVSAATLSADGLSVILTTARQAEGTDYTITVNNVQDLGGNAIAAGSTIQFKSFSFLIGSAYMEQWPDEAPVNNLATFVQHRIGYGAAPETPIPPSSSSIQPFFETPSWENGENYGGRLYAWFIPEISGDYVFYCTSDDASWLMLSTNDDPANKRKIAAEPSWNNRRAWKGAIRTDNTDSGRDATGLGFLTNQSDTWLDSEWGMPINTPAQTGANVITLQANQRYYIEAVWKEGGGGDGFGATYRLASEAETAVNNGDAPRLTGARIGAYADTSTLPPTILAPTAHQRVQVDSGETVTWTVEANNPAAGALTYQWELNGRDIPGATGAQLVLANVAQKHIGQYRVRVSNANGSVISPLMNVMVLVPADGVFNIEAEDFDNNGQPVASASEMPYLGGAYDGLAAVHGVDYNHNENLAATDWTPIYRTGAPVTGPTQSPFGNETTQVTAQFRAQGWQMTANYKIGWIGAGDWANYTRTFPAGDVSYNVFVASSYDGTAANQINHDIGRVTAGVGTATQTVEPIGSFRAPGSAGWSRNNLVAMVNSNDPYDLATVQLSGTVTIRWTQTSGDAEYLLFIPAQPIVVGPTVGEVTTAPNGDLVIPFTGSALQASENVATGYSDVATQSPYQTPPTGPQRFFRSRE